MALSLPSSSSSSSSRTPQLNYDVFLSFRGEDTRNNFISHLHKALRDKAIQTFIDDELRRGDEISPSLLRAIEESRISIIIFSKDYASSRWCLEELVKILECKENHQQIVIPVFYEIDPSHVRNQTGCFAVSFAKHKKRPKMVSLDKVQRWKDALKEAANLSGFHSSGFKTESVLIEDIVQDVLKRLNDLSSIDTSHLVGIDSKIVEIESMLSIGTNDVRSVGIWGMGGIGKTTLAETVFNKISRQFDSSYFCRNVRERCEQSNGLYNLQRELLSALLGDGNANIGTFPVGRTFIKNRLGRKKLLVVFDDVSDYKKIEYLIGGPDCLSPQSRIIITARDKQVLKQVDRVYKVQELIHDEALDLFRRHAFERNQYPTEDYEELSNTVTRYAGGIPLALKVLGSYLLGRGKEIWKSAVDKLERIFPDKDMLELLKISFDGLDDEVQKIFLDIACLLDDEVDDIELVKSFLDACGFHAEIGIDTLINKSLIVISYNTTITTHDLLKAMAREIVRHESVDEPGKRSRLWHHEDIYHVLTKNTGTEKIEGISLDMSKISDLRLDLSAFANMPSLRVLKFFYSDCINKVHVPQALETYFPELRYLMWHGCPIKSLLLSVYPENLVKLDMSCIKVKQLWNGCLPLVKLKEIDVSYSSLISCPDFSGSPNLKRLILQGCEYLPEISPSIQYLIELDLLQLRGCCSLKGIPDCSNLISLRELDLSWCFNLEMLPEMPCNIEELWLMRTAIKGLPLSTENLSRLQILDLSDCKKLKTLTIQSIDLSDIVELPEFPEGCLPSLSSLCLSGTSIESIPASIVNLSKLSFLNISNCRRLKYLPKLQLGNICAYGCTSLEVVPGLSFGRLNHICQLQEAFIRADFVNCFKLDQNIFDDTVEDALLNINQVDQPVRFVYTGSEIPKCFNFQNMGSIIDVELPPDWSNNNFLAFAICIVVSAHPKYDGPVHSGVEWECNFKSKKGHQRDRRNTYQWSFASLNHVSVDYPILPFCFHELCSENEISFQFHVGSSSCKIEKCGVHLIFGQHLEEVYESSLVGEDEDVDEPQMIGGDTSQLIKMENINKTTNSTENMNKRPRGKAIWDTASVALYCDLCIVEVEAGRRSGTDFTKFGWDNLIVNFNKATGREYGKLQLKKKWDALKNDWKLWKQLIGKETGLGWNAQLKTIDAPEDWWLSKLEVHPGVAKFRKEGIDVEMEAKLDRMFMNITATGDYVWAPSSGVLPSKDCQILDDDHVIPLDVNNLIQIKYEDGEGLEKENNKRKLEEDDKHAIKKKKSKKMVVKSGKGGGSPKLSQQIDRLIDAIESKKEANFGISEVMKLVESLPGVEIGSDLWLFSTHLFLAKEKREMFSIMKNPEIMLKWLNYEKSRESLN